MSCNTTNQGFKYHAFLSCAGEDKIYVKEFYNRLCQYGARVFYYDVLEDGSYGQNPNEFLYEVLRNSQHFIFYWTANTNKEWINREIEYFDTYCKNGQNRVIIVYQDIVGKPDYAQLNKSLRDDYYREVNFAELLKRIGADSGAYMERRYFRLMEFLNKPRKQLDVAMKVGAGCCIWSAPIIREIMDYGGIHGADIAFFEKDQVIEIPEGEPGGKNSGIKSDATAAANAKLARKYRYEVKRQPYFYSRLDKKKRFLTIPPYIKACQLAKDDLNTVLNNKLEDWLANFNMLDFSADSYNDILKLFQEGYDKLTVYELHNLAPKQFVLFLENTVEGGFARLDDKFQLNGLVSSFVEKEIINVFIEKLPPGVKQEIEREISQCKSIVEFLLRKSETLGQVLARFRKGDGPPAAPAAGSGAGDNQTHTDASTQGQGAPGEAADKYATLNKELKDFAVLSSVLGAVDADNEAEKLPKIEAWRDMLLKLCKLIGLDATGLDRDKRNIPRKGFFYEKEISDLEVTVLITKALNQQNGKQGKLKVKLYNDAKQEKKLLVFDRAGEKRQAAGDDDTDSDMGYISQETLNKIKGQFNEILDFAYYDEISNTKLYTAKDIVGMVHDNELDCVIVPGEVYEQEHEKGKNRDVLTKIASIMYTVEGGCDFRFITRNKKTYEKLKELIKENVSVVSADKSAEEERGPGEAVRPGGAEGNTNPKERTILAILNKLKKEAGKNDAGGENFRNNRVKILYTPNTVARKYHEKYLSEPGVIPGRKAGIRVVHDPVDFGDWNELKGRIIDILGSDGKPGDDDVLLVLGWQPQMGWIDTYFNTRRGYYVKEISLLDFHGVEDLPYLSYDIMMRTNVLDTWFRSYAFESFLGAVKGSIAKLNESMGNVLDQENEVMKIAKFLNMDKEECRKYLKVINFEFRYDARYFKLYEQYIRKMNSDC